MAGSQNLRSITLCWRNLEGVPVVLAAVPVPTGCPPVHQPTLPWWRKGGGCRERDSDFSFWAHVGFGHRVGHEASERHRAILWVDRGQATYLSLWGHPLGL